MAYALRGMLRLRDTDGDGSIGAADLSIEQFSLVLAGGFSLQGARNVPPGDLNAMLSDVDSLVQDGGDAFADALSDSGVDVDDLQGILDSTGEDVCAYCVSTGPADDPGAGDNDGDGLEDEECRDGDDDAQDDAFGKKVRFGAEARLPVVALRAGAHQGYASLGAGLKLPGVSIEWAYSGRELGSLPGAEDQILHSVELRFGT